MPKIDRNLYDFLSEPKMFEATVKLIDSFEVFKKELFINFWEKLAITLKESEKLPNWKVILDEKSIEYSHTHISITNVADDESSIYFYVYYEQKRSIPEFIYGINYNNNSNRIKNIEKIISNVKILKDSAGILEI